MSVINRWQRLANRGDTIVEVLVAVIVISIVLTTVYALSTRTISQNENTQEQSQAVRLAQGQLESLKSYLNGGGTAIANTGFCFSNGTLYTLGGGVPTASTPDNFSAYSTNCKQPFSGSGTCSSGQANCFYYAIKQIDPSGHPNQYTAFVRWPAQHGSLNSQEQTYLVYRVY